MVSVLVVSFYVYLVRVLAWFCLPYCRFVDGGSRVDRVCCVAYDSLVICVFAHVFVPYMDRASIFCYAISALCICDWICFVLF